MDYKVLYKEKLEHLQYVLNKMKYEKDKIRKFICLLCFKRFSELPKLKEHMVFHANRFRD